MLIAEEVTATTYHFSRQHKGDHIHIVIFRGHLQNQHIIGFAPYFYGLIVAFQHLNFPCPFVLSPLLCLLPEFVVIHYLNTSPPVVEKLIFVYKPNCVGFCSLAQVSPIHCLAFRFGENLCVHRVLNCCVRAELLFPVQ